MTTLHRLSLAALSGALLIVSFPGNGDQAWLAFVALVPLRHERAMYVKQAARGDERFLIYEQYPQPREVITH